MFVEMGLIGGGWYCYDRIKNKDIYYVKSKIKKMFEKNNIDYYPIYKVNRKLPWGYEVLITLGEHGFNKLNNLQDEIQTSIGYPITIEQSLNYELGIIKVIVNPPNTETIFAPVKVKPYEIFVSLNNTNQNLIVNLQKFPHVLVSGQTGCGKTEEIRSILTNSIYFHTARDLNLYFADLSDMCDFDIFKNCKQTKAYVKNIEDSTKLFEYLMHIYTKRLQIFEKNNCKNIQEYNSRFYGKRMAYNFIVLDEFADYFPTTKLDKNYKQKVLCYNYLKEFARKFRKVGSFLICGIQRPDTTVLDPNLRSCLCTKIGFSQNSDASSLTVCDTAELTNIENRKGLLMYGNKREWFYSLAIDDNLIKENIKNSILENRGSYTDYNKFLNTNNNAVPMKTKKCEKDDNPGIKKDRPKTKTKLKVKKNVK
ncbi:FtsK/SpoIIIE domain-containing protein [Clostridium autoethanogenum]|uniref:FtsK/SpoIIIE domain-containing protein n=1 Tax=Clostridium autoethanogenum DSM 10061 TaxID=1341692 RepID=A0ABN4BJL1_9CLOT|nr:FtsK/SpoIIIE domain-containing protein [Clostridium autoethanogenum]AGY77956.1 FtsK/SpoIIIE domain-containing protein [Clostridium autoethanogenum DSM 10061]ALU38090.1 Hypothetical protein CLAU_3663 [Clostridium autoethanogenum DSM 10061]OVY50854.1 DNA translocase SpoIIIE [Clostridium autoethanogenum]